MLLESLLISYRKIAWSKNGSLAYISPDGYAVHLKVFSRDTATGKWDLGKDVPIEVPQGRDNFPFVHLSWNSLGNDLAVMDSAGHVMVFSCAIALDRMQLVRAELAHPEAEADSVVGVHWLAIYPHEAKVSHLPFQSGNHTKMETESYCVVGRPRWQQVELAHPLARVPGCAPSYCWQGFAHLPQKIWRAEASISAE
jgi:hypothetical protein